MRKLVSVISYEAIDKSRGSKSSRCYESGVNVLSNRLREAMELRGVDQTALAKGVGITQGAISLILRGKTRKSKHLPEIAAFLGVRLAWLTGLSDSTRDRLADDDPPTSSELALVRLLRTLPPDKRELLTQIAEGLALKTLVDSGAITIRDLELGVGRGPSEISARSLAGGAPPSETVHARGGGGNAALHNKQQHFKGD